MAIMAEEFLQFVQDQLAGLGDVTARKMFGGIGLRSGGVFFAIIYRDELFFKVDDESVEQYRRAGSEPFSPGGDMTLKSYYNVPAEVLEDRQQVTDWARRAIRAQENKSKNTKKRGR